MVSDLGAVERGLTVEDLVDPKTGRPVRKYSTNGTPMDPDVKQRLRRQLENGLNFNADSLWLCGEYEDLPAGDSVIECIETPAAPIPESITGVSIGDSRIDGNYPAPTSLRTYSVKGFVSSAMSGRIATDPVYGSLGMATVAVGSLTGFAAGNEAGAILISSEATAELGAAIKTAVDTAAASGATSAPELAAAATQAWVVARSVPPDQVVRVTNYTHRVANLLYRFPRSMTNMGSWLSRAARGPVGPLVERDSSILEDYVSRFLDPGRGLDFAKGARDIPRFLLAVKDSVANILNIHDPAQRGLFRLYINIFDRSFTLGDIVGMVLEFEKAHYVTPTHLWPHSARVITIIAGGLPVKVIELAVTLSGYSATGSTLTYQVTRYIPLNMVVQ